MLNRVLKKSIFSKLFLMNLLILICIVGSQIVFQMIYFDRYYFNSKEKRIENAIKEFESLLNKETDENKIMNFIKEVKDKEDIALSFNDFSFNQGIRLESYMGDRQVIINDNKSKEKYKIVLGDQFANVNINKGDYIKLVGMKNQYGYVFPSRIFINGIELQKYYELLPGVINTEIIPSITLEPSQHVDKSMVDVYIEGFSEELIKEDNSYSILATADLYISIQEILEIGNNYSYTGKFENDKRVEDVLFTSKHFGNGYILAVTTLSEVNEVMETMNNYYFMVFFIVLILVIIISFVYSKLMSKPLVEMSKVAKRISECDFQYKYNVSSEDEVGILGSSLNLISENLEKSLNELQDANLKLKGDMEMKKAQEEKRKELIANISHELKTPITIIQGSVNGIKSGMYTEDMYEDILEETNKMNELVKEMLEISKLESPGFKLKKEPFDLGSVFLKEKDKLKGMIREKDLEINHDDFDEIIAFGDEKRINQVVTNLLTNAIKYTPDGGKIKVSIKLEEEKNQYVFSIENFGVTLNKGELDKLWDPFYRKEKSRNKKFGGTGLGLSIVKRILEVHNSDFGVESKENSVIFYFSISRCMAY